VTDTYSTTKPIEVVHHEETVRLTVAQALLRFLARQFTERDGTRCRTVAGVYGIFGHGNTGGLGEALSATPQGEFMFLEGRNEQSMVHAAAAYARATRRMSTLACTASVGPGSLNMVTATAGAHINRLPVLVLPADEYADRKPGTILQGLEHPRAGDLSVNDCFRPVARYFDKITRPEQLLVALPAAMRVLTSPEDTGPVVLCLPQDVQTEAHDFPSRFFEERTWYVDRPAPDPEAVARAADVISGARRPLIVAGGGVFYSAAEEALRRFAATHGIPVAETYAGRGVMAKPGWCSLGGLGVEGTTPANEAAREADVVICAGTRLADFVSGAQSAFQDPAVRFVGLNIDRKDATKNSACAVVGDLRCSLSALSSALQGRRITPPEFEATTAVRVDAWSRGLAEFVGRSASGERMSQLAMLRVINDEAPAGSTVVSAAGTLPGEVLKLWDTSGGTHCHIEFGFSCMGYEVPGGIGVALANPKKPAIVVVGDGTFLMSPSELVTAVQNGLRLVVIVSENGGMHSIRRLEEAFVGRPYANLFRHRDMWSREFGNEPVALDLVAIAGGLGACASRAVDAAELRKTLQEALSDLTRPHVIVVPTDPSLHMGRNEVWHDIAPAEVSADPRVADVRADYDRKQSARQRRFL
jgi:3D-(3,5/4)-trihydroxycyclohexane-1,2-dione acylhydrolase (decyclizing)